MKNIYLVFLFITTIYYCSVDSNEPLPILYWHSAGESCCEKEYEMYSTIIRKYLGINTYIKSVQIGTSVANDKFLSIKMHPFEQIKMVCNDIKNDTNLRKGYNGIGLSQGALFLRGLVQVCEGGPKMHNLISLGGPHQGVYQYPTCGKISSVICGILRFQMNKLIYSRPSQNFLAPTTYWHDIVEQRYLKGSTFLAIINNEISINENYRNNLKSLNRLVLVKYAKDSSIVPSDSSFFSYYDSFRNVVPLLASSLYHQDKLGLKVMIEKDQVVFLTSPGAHLELNDSWFLENIVPFLKD